MEMIRNAVRPEALEAFKEQEPKRYAAEGQIIRESATGRAAQRRLKQMEKRQKAST